MLYLEKKEDCCGCTACESICPVGCITMQPDEEGFVYPYIDKDECIDCHKCEKVCPIKKDQSNSKQIDAICARSLDKEIVEDSTSGGFFTPLAQFVLEKQGSVIGVECSDDNIIKHIAVNDEKKLYKLRGSKYVQSDLKDVFRKVKKELDNGRIMCFSGTPCQVSGLLSYLDKDYENLVTVDMVCKGVPSPKLWKKYVEYQQNKYKSRIKKVVFRKKTYGYHSGTMELSFENGKRYHGSGRVDFFLKSFYKEICSRPSCYSCSFKTDAHVSDFTIFESWHASEVVQGLRDDDLGYTSVLINSDKGRNIFSEIKNQYEWYSIDKEHAIELDGIMVRNNAIPHPKRKEYYKDLDNVKLDEQISKFIPVSKRDYLLEKSKSFLYKTKLLYIVKKIIK